MGSFLTYLESAFERNFVQGLYNNVVRQLYRLLADAVQLHADMISVSPTDLTISKQGVVIDSVDISAHERIGPTLPPKMRKDWMSHRTALAVILKHDAGVRQHLQLVEETPEL